MEFCGHIFTISENGLCFPPLENQGPTALSSRSITFLLRYYGRLRLLTARHRDSCFPCLWLPDLTRPGDDEISQVASPVRVSTCQPLGLRRVLRSSGASELRGQGLPLVGFGRHPRVFWRLYRFTFVPACRRLSYGFAPLVAERNARTRFGTAALQPPRWDLHPLDKRALSWRTPGPVIWRSHPALKMSLLAIILDLGRRLGCLTTPSKSTVIPDSPIFSTDFFPVSFAFLTGICYQ